VSGAPFQFTSGPHSAKLVLLGEAWGEQEETYKVPFAGQSGRELFRMLGDAWGDGEARAIANLRSDSEWLREREGWLERNDILLTNVFALRPPKNNLGALCGLKGEMEDGYNLPPVRSENPRYVRSELALPELRRLATELAVSPRHLVLALGAPALWALTGSAAIGSLRGAVGEGRVLTSDGPGKLAALRGGDSPGARGEAREGAVGGERGDRAAPGALATGAAEWDGQPANSGLDLGGSRSDGGGGLGRAGARSNLLVRSREDGMEARCTSSEVSQEASREPARSLLVRADGGDGSGEVLSLWGSGIRERADGSEKSQDASSAGAQGAALGEHGRSRAEAAGQASRAPAVSLKLLPTYHPAAVLRAWHWRVIVLADLLKAARERRSPAIVRPVRAIRISPSIGEVEEWTWRALRGNASGPPATLLAPDIETLNGQIRCIGFARSVNDVLVVPFVARLTGGSYWGDEGDELRAWACVRALLESPIPKVGQNFLFDLQYLTRYGIHARNVLHDTMLLHHALFPEMQKGLGFLGSVYTNEQSWKMLRRHKGEEELKRDE
jgi:uracil-DNA glycosylase